MLMIFACGAESRETLNELKLVLSAATKALFVKKTHLAMGLILPVIIYFVTRETLRWFSSYASLLLLEDYQNSGVVSLSESGFIYKSLCITFIESALISMAGIYIVINIHRILLGRYVSKNRSIFSVYKKFCWLSLILFPIYLIVSLPFWMAYSYYLSDATDFSQLMIIGGLILWLGGMSLVSRVALVFPSIAIGHPISIKKSIELTRPHKLLMSVVIAVVPLLIIGLDILLRYISISKAVFLPFSYVKLIVYFLIEVSLLSMAYLYIIKENKMRTARS